jgi:GDPmannose 4,6-dehydratase
MTRALITGIGGQDGSYLAELLLDNGYEVYGIGRSGGAYPNLTAIADRVELLPADVLDQQAMADLFRKVQPREIYNLASVSFVPASWEHPVETAELAAVGVTALLEAVRAADPTIRFYQASSSEIFGEPLEVPQNEATPLSPLTPYGVAKAYAQFITRSYRRRYGLHASAGILYNHESPRRPLQFLPIKIANAVARIAAGLDREVLLGDLDARRDWGYAVDYVHAMWLVLQQPEADDYIISSGEQHSVGELAEIAFGHAGLDWREHVRVDPALQRGAAQLHHLVGDPARAERQLGWRRSVDFAGLIRLLVDAEVKKLSAAQEDASTSR